MELNLMKNTCYKCKFIANQYHQIARELHYPVEHCHLQYFLFLKNKQIPPLLFVNDFKITSLRKTFLK